MFLALCFRLSHLPNMPFGIAGAHVLLMAEIYGATILSKLLTHLGHGKGPVSHSFSVKSKLMATEIFLHLYTWFWSIQDTKLQEKV